MNTAKAIRQAITSIPEGKPFPAKDLLQFGTRAAVDQILYRMAKDNQIQRIARGVYLRPKWNKYVNRAVMPEPYEVAKLLAETRGVKIGPTGAEAAQRLGLSTQMPVRPVYVTTGRTREVKMGNDRVIQFRHVSPNKMEHAGTPIGTAIMALRHLGKKRVTVQVIAKLAQTMKAEDFQQLRQATSALPGWATDQFFKYEVNLGRRVSQAIAR